MVVARSFSGDFTRFEMIVEDSHKLSGDGDILRGPLVPNKFIYNSKIKDIFIAMPIFLTTHNALRTFRPILICTSSTRPFS